MRIPVIGGTGLPGNAVSQGWVAETVKATGRDTDGGVSAALSPRQRKPVR